MRRRGGLKDLDGKRCLDGDFEEYEQPAGASSYRKSALNRL